MALTWSVSGVKNYEHVTTSPQTRGKKEDVKWHPVTDQLVWLSLSCGFNEITEKNWEKVADRIAVIQHVTGAALMAQDGEIYVTKEDVKLHTGLTTNATRMTDQRFSDHIMNLARENARGVLSGYRNRGFSSDGQQEMSAYDVCELLAKKYGSDVE